MEIYLLIFLMGFASIGCLIIAGYLYLSKLLSNRTYYAQEKTEIAMQKNKRPRQTDKPVELSVIYKISNLDDDLIPQIEQAAFTIKRTMGENFPFEIICVVSPGDYRAMNSLSQHMKSNRYLTVIQKDASGIRWLISGFAISRGKLILNGDFLHQEITNLRNKTYSFFVLSEPAPSPVSGFCNHKDRSIPVSFSRAAGEAVLERIHVLVSGYSHEIIYLCRKCGIPVEFIKQKQIGTQAFFFELIWVRVVAFVSDLMYRTGIWTASAPRHVC